jgi:hypothetical protein
LTQSIESCLKSTVAFVFDHRIESMASTVHPARTLSPAPADVRARATWSGRLSWLVFGLPAVGIGLLDLWSRMDRFPAFAAADVAAYALASAQTLLFWASLGVLATSPQPWCRHLGAVVTVVLATLLLGSQSYAWAQYAAYIDFHAALLGNTLRSSLPNQLAADAPHLAKHLLPPLLGSIAWLFLARRFTRPHRRQHHWAGITLPLTLLSILLLPWSQRRLLLHALGKTAAVGAGLLDNPWATTTPQQPIHIPRLTPTPTRHRNVVLVIDESIRKDVTCVDYDPSCATTPHSNAAAPKRIGLGQLRSLDSATLVSLSVLWSGLSPLVPNEERAASPQLFHFVRAASLQSGYATSQNLDFASSRTLIEPLPIDLFAEARDLVDNPDIDLGAPDELTAEKAVHFASRLREPFLLVVQFANVHYPFRTDPNRSPFQPSAITKDPARSEEFFNHYKNAVHLHDRATGALLEGLRSLPSGPRTVVIYTSDHGEAFGEHGQYGHTLSIFDEEVHVPGWVDAPEGTLTEEERAQLMIARDAFTWHADIAPTILDLLGLWDEPEVKRFRDRMLGTSLLRGLTTKPVPITNCTEQWGCAFRNWGVMKDGKKLEARAWDRDWHCYDILADPAERNDLGAEACGALVEEARKLYGSKPGD